VAGSLIEEEQRRQSKIVPGPSKGKEHARDTSISGDSYSSTRTSHSSAQCELHKAIDRIANTLDGNQRDIAAIHDTGAYATKMAAAAERAASNMGQQLQDIATVVRSLQKSAEHWESWCRRSDSRRESDPGERTTPQNNRTQPSNWLSREEEARENRAPVTQEPRVTIEEETPQSDPKELKRNIELWKQREAEASRKHMLALKKKANRVEHELGQLYKEQRPQEELNAAVERNRQSRNALSSYQHVRVVGLSGDTCHEQRDTLGYLRKVLPFEGNNRCP
jgi:hypothetical protein